MTTGNQNDADNVNNIDNIEINAVIALEENKLKNAHEFVKGEKILLIIACVTAVLCDRLFFNPAINQSGNGNLFFFAAIFEICFIVLFCCFNWEKIYKKPLLWVVAVLILSLCVWNFIFDYASDYGVLTFFVIPASLMMFTQITAENPDLRNISGMVISWFSGWFMKPFTAIIKCAEVLAVILFPKNGEKGAVIKKIAAAVLITVPLLAVLILLLSGADKVFGYYVNKIFSSFDAWDFILHGVLIVIGFFLFYSFFWNGKYGKSKNEENMDNAVKIKKEYKVDNLIVYIILSSVLILYVLFCAIQFTYLFASAGLPAGISYSDYAKEGFAQIVVISGINLVIFGCVLKYGKMSKYDGKTEKDIVLKVMLYILIAVTGIMLVSGFMRLRLYINTFGMTFLRLISAWFIIYLSLVLILCVGRMIYEQIRKIKLPLIAFCAILLLLSYNILGYINPDSFIVKYNLTENTVNNDVNKWVDENMDYVFYALSDDAVNALIDKGLDKNKYAEFLEQRYDDSGNKYSAASMKLRSDLGDD
ncbi:MAG: DUF4173 domain-containing protein [Oscillospiraceae bacterium]|nr:DUF4173 domain-containing protein [Oscillospiraceae bacterium]